ncbi:hypothetical protein BDV25DRAFT_36675 [Aspergillus avenaceus]|uniref:Secreted protein n=1 Tax=Aspergillus avenaceus TaxID=36643 RepID=A0A5N6TLM1_ASPAV|nr:hypothetical protein BDV25DRAFT_36675 [Aspergillus avenaceus]
MITVHNLMVYLLPWTLVQTFRACAQGTHCQDPHMSTKGKRDGQQFTAFAPHPLLHPEIGRKLSFDCIPFSIPIQTSGVLLALCIQGDSQTPCPGATWPVSSQTMICIFHIAPLAELQELHGG